jgi:hypothetical protein
LILKEADTLKQARKPATVVIVLLIIFLLLLQGSAAFAATRFQEVLTRYTNIFTHTGRVQHEHKYAFDGGIAAFFAEGTGSASGVHDGWSVTNKPYLTASGYVYSSYNSSYGYYYGATARDALPGQYMRIISGSSSGTEHSNQVGVMPNPGEKGYVNETISSSSSVLEDNTNRKGYFRHSSGAGTSDGTMRVNKETNGSTTTVNVEGYSEILETYIEDSGGSKVGWWSLP